MLRSSFDRVQLRRVRRAYTRVSGLPSSAAGFDGMVEEMGAGLDAMDDGDRREADGRVLYTIFGGGVSVAALRGLSRAAPGWTARAMAALSPVALRWLVGRIEHPEPGVNVVPACRFREAGGERLCAEVCRGPTERFCADTAVPVSLRPDTEGTRCEWTWGCAG